MPQSQPSIIPPRVTISQKRLYANQGYTYALETSDGAIQTTYPFSTIFAPIIIENRIYIIVHAPYHKSMMNTIQTDNGNILWSYHINGTLDSNVTVSNEVAYAITIEGMLYALQTCDGSLLWQYNHGGPYQCPSPTASNEIVYVTPRVKPPEKPFIAAHSVKNGTLLCKTPIAGFTIFPMGALDGILYAGHTAGGIYAKSIIASCAAYRADDGSLLWQQPLPGRACSSPAIAEGKVFFSIAENTMNRIGREISHRTRSFLCSFRAKDGLPLWQQAIEDTDDLSGPTAPVIDKNTIYIGSHGSLYTFNVDDGTPQWQYQTGCSSVSTPVVADDTVFFGADDGCVYALNTKNGTLRWKTFVSTAVTMTAEVSFVPTKGNDSSSTQNA